VCKKVPKAKKAIFVFFRSLVFLAKLKSDKKSRWKQGTCFHFLPRRRRIIIIIIIIEIIII